MQYIKLGAVQEVCSVSSLAAPQIHIGLKHSKLWRNLCSFRKMKLNLSFPSSLTPGMSQMLQPGFLSGLTFCSKLLLNSAMEEKSWTTLSD